MATPRRQPDERRQKAAALLQQQRRTERRRRSLIIGVPAAVVVVIAAVVAAVLIRPHQDSATSTATSAATSANRLDVAQQIIPPAPTGTAVAQQTPTRVANDTGVSGVLAYDTSGYPAAGQADAGTLQHDHVTTPVTYAVTPPVGGPHNGIWMNAGVYTEPIPSERAVHNLEHGAVWITYRPDLDASTVAQLRDFVSQQTMIPETSIEAGQANRYVDLSPWADDQLPAPIVISSWGYQLRVDDASDPRLQQFVDTFRNSSTYTPEYGSPVDGIPIQTGGRPAADGGAKANPAGSVTG